MSAVQLDVSPSEENPRSDMDKDIRTRNNRRNEKPSNSPERRNTQGQNSSNTEMDNPSLGNFRVLYLVSQLTGITIVIMVVSWISVHLGGFSWTSNPRIEFNWHPLLMTLGMVFLYGNSILIYRGFRNVSKKKLKLWHASLNASAFILVIIGLVAAFDSHNLVTPPIPNLYSLHSWVGLGAVILFACQWVGGFTLYLLPGMSMKYKQDFMPYHVYLGLCGFILSIAASLIGLTEKAIFSLTIGKYTELPNAGLIINFIGVLMVVFGGLVVYLTTKSEYKRIPLPEDTILLTGNNE